MTSPPAVDPPIATRHAVTREILRAAVCAWLNDNAKLIDEAISKRSFLVIQGVARRLLDAVAKFRREGLSYADAAARLGADDTRREEEALLDQLMRDGQILSPSTWATLWEKATVPHIAIEVRGLADQMSLGEISSADAILRLDGARERLSAAGPTEDLFKVSWVNDPEREEIAPPLEPWIEGLLYPGLTTASGPWKIGKTWFWLDGSIRIAAGIPFLGRKVRKGRPGWLQVDMTPADFAEYARKLREGGQPVVGLPFFSDGRIDLKRPDHQHELCARLKDQGIDILFIDSCRAATSVKENESDEVATFTRRFLCGELRDRLGISIVLITHAAKGSTGGARGSGDWDAAADSCLSFSLNESGETTIKGKGRHPPLELTFAIDDLTAHSGGVVIRERQAGHRAVDEGRRKDARVEDFLRSNPDFCSLRTIMDQAHVGFEKAKEEVNRLHGRGLVEHDGRPEKDRKWRWCPNCRPGAFPAFPNPTLGNAGNTPVGSSSPTGEVFPALPTPISGNGGNTPGHGTAGLQADGPDDEHEDPGFKTEPEEGP